MPHREYSEGKKTKSKGKPRGRPFSQGSVPHNKPKFNSEVLDAPGNKIGDEGGFIDMPTVIDASFFDYENQASKNTTVSDAEMKKIIENEVANLTLIESVDFTNGKNKLSVRLSKKSNRLYRLQIFLNDQTEIRPTTYNGSTTANSVWSLLKGVMK